ncbi:class I SAM-dependent methyltransferase [Agrobacterium sp. S2]|nr:class I SAM-dependent methyltransferase [Agrobacterium sp. S2]
MKDIATTFMDAAAVASYVDETPLKVPGLADLHKMATVLLEEQASSAPHILVVGAGGGMEIKTMAQSRPNWRFLGVDPSAPMLDIARQTTSLYADRVEYLLGTVDLAPRIPFDGATCLLTLHFLGMDARLQLLRGIRDRLRPGSALVVAHHTAPEDDAKTWLARSVAFARGSGSRTEQVRTSSKAMADRLPLLSPVEEVASFQDAGFSNPTLFYAGLSFRGWVMTTGKCQQARANKGGLE